MKAQRYSTKACDDEFIEDSKGEWMLSDDGDKLEAEVEALRTENEMLLLGSAEAAVVRQSRITKLGAKVEGLHQANQELDRDKAGLANRMIEAAVVTKVLRQKVENAEWWIEHRSEFTAPPGLQWWDALSRTVASLRRRATREASDE